MVLLDSTPFASEQPIFMMARKISHDWLQHSDGKILGGFSFFFFFFP